MAIIRNVARTLRGLSIEETVEFELLDALPAMDDDGNPAWIFEGEPTTRREKRWLELYSKHARANPAHKILVLKIKACKKSGGFKAARVSAGRRTYPSS